VSSPGAAELLAGGVPTVVVELPAMPGIDPAAAALLRLAAFTFAPGVWPDGSVGWPLPLSPRELVERGVIATPDALAAVAAAGDPLAAPWRTPQRLALAGCELRAAGAASRVRWGLDVTPGDAVTAGQRWAVLVADDGDGSLSLGDRALFAWAATARFGTLAEALGGPEPGAALALRVRRLP
jgi:hypothetical protein